VKKGYLIALVGALTLFALLAFIPLGSCANPAALGRTMDAGHTVTFFLLGGLLYFAIEHHGKWKALAITAIASTLLMVAIEAVQPYVGRTASLADVRLGVLGMLLALGGIVIWHHVNHWMLRVVQLLLLVAALLWIVSPALNEWRALWLREQQFPLLGSFEHELEKKLWKASGRASGKRTHISFSDQHLLSGANSLKIETVNGSWSGVSYAAGDQNWKGYQALSMTFYNPGSAFSFNLRIDDGLQHAPSHSERYNGRLRVDKGASTVMIPLAEIAAGPRSRLLHLDQIRRMILFSSRNEKPRVFYLDDVRLVP